MVQRDLFTKKKEIDSQTQKTNLELKEDKDGGVNWEIGINIYTLLYITQITNKDLLYNTGNSVVCNELYRKRISNTVDMYETDSLCCCTAETNTTL